MKLLDRVNGLNTAIVLLCAALLAPAAAQAQVAYRGEGSFDTRGNCGSIGPSLPAGTAAGDLLLAAVVSGSAPTLSMPGWTQLFLNNPVGTLTSALYWRWATGGDPTTVSQAGSCNVLAARISGFTGVDPTQPFSTAPLAPGNWSYQNSGSVTSGTQTTAVAGAMLVFTGHITDNSNTDPLAGYTQAYNVTTTTGNDVALSLYYALQGAPGTFGPYTVNKNRGADPNHGVLFALRPKSAVVSINRANPDPSSAATVSWTVTFSQTVSGGSSSNFTLVNSGLGGTPAITSVTGSGATRTVTASTGTGNGTLGLNMANTTGVSPALTNLPFTGQVYSIDRTVPAVSSITRVDPTPTALANVSWTVTFSKNVSGVDAGDFSLAQAGGVSGALITAVTPVNGAVYTVSASTGSGNGTLGLNLADDDSIIDAASNPLGGAGAGNGNFSGQIYDLVRPMTVTLSPTACVNDASIGTQPWTTLTGPLASDDSWATASGVNGDITNYLKCTGYGFSIPPGATINGISVAVEAHSVRTMNDYAVRLVKAGAIQVTNYATNTRLSNPDAYTTYGGTADLWGSAWTVADINSANFGVAFAAQRGAFATSDTAYVDHMPITVIYTLPANAAVVSINRAGANPASAPTVSWTVVFDRSVTGVDASAFALAASGLSGAYISTVTGSGTTWTVTASTGIGAGTLGLNQTGPGAVSPALSGTFTGQVYTISATPALAEYRMDAASWNGTLGEVTDSAGSYPGRAVNSANTTDGSRAIPGTPGTCRYGVFDNGTTITKGYVELPGFPNLNTDFTITAWIRTTDNTVGAQRILIDDESNTGGYGLSLGEGGAGVLRFYWRGASAVILDTANVISNNTWYFVAAVADVSNGMRRIYVYDATGSLLPGLPVSVASTAGGIDAGMASIGAETNASGEAPATNHFKGNIDEVRVYNQALNQAAVTAIATQSHACSVVVAVPDHYELSLPANGIACLPSTVTVTACTDASSPCSNPFAAASGTTAVLATSGGTLGATPVSFDATGVASTTLSYPAAPDGTPVTVTLSGEQTAASNPRQWCPNGVGCVVANSGTATFNTAGFIFSTAAGGGVATIPTQVAGISSVAYYLRAVKTSTTTKACEAALVGPSTVDFAYECNNPASCYTSNLMSVNGGAATTIARNNNGSVASYLPANMSFDANGNAPFTFNYADAGQVKLWARKSAGGALLSTLNGSSNSFVVKPHHFDITNIACTTVGAGSCAPANGTGNNPAASGPGGAAFIQAGKSFKATVTAMNGAATPAFTPNFGKETPAEGAELSSFNHLPGLGGASAIARVLGGFNLGAATLSDLVWNEVGVLQLHATLSNPSGYLGSDVINGKNSVVSAVNPYVGRFIPDHFDTVVTPQGGGFAYSGNPAGPVPGQPFSVTVTARNASAAATLNYNNAGGYAKNANLSVPVGGATGQLYVDAVAGGASAVPAAKFLNGVGNVDRLDATGRISFVFNSLPFAEQAIQVHAEDADSVTSSGANGSINIRHGRLRVFNAFGSDKADLSLPLRAEYWTGSSWVPNSADSFSLIPAASVALSAYTGTLSAVNLGASHVTGTTLAGGQGSIVLAKPAPAATGSVDLAINLGSGAADQSCLGSHPATSGAAIPWLRSINGDCALTYDRDPSARGSFGIYAPETRKTIHVRELF